MDKNKTTFYTLLLTISIALLYFLLSSEKKVSQNTIITKTTETHNTAIAPIDAQPIRKHEDDSNNDLKAWKEEKIKPEQIEEPYVIKTIYSTLTADHQYKIYLTSDRNISSKPIQKKYDSGIVINENIIVYGKIDDNLSYRMLFGKDIIDNVNNITFVLQNNNTEEKQEATPEFLYSIDRAGEYRMNIHTSPLSFDVIEYIEPKHNMNELMEKIQKQIGTSNNGEKTERLFPESPMLSKAPL
ncbi:MAG: hypothetical protein Q7S59_06605 [Sulfurimonas sp.]|nr:hypothetical protein [Sulfurimonas sp.]